MIPAPSQSRNRGNSLGPVLLIVGALGVSAAVFFTFTRKQIEQKREATAAAAAAEKAKEPEKPVAIAQQPADPQKQNAPATNSTPAVPQPPPPPPKPVFNKPAELAASVAQKLSSGNLAEAVKMLAPGDAKQAEQVAVVLDKVVNGLGYKPSAADKVQVIGQVENTMRVSVPLNAPVAGVAPARLILDLERDSKAGWKVAQIHLPKELEPALASLPKTGQPVSTASVPVATPGSSPSVSTPPAPALQSSAGAPMQPKPLFVVDAMPDAMTFAADFVTALLKSDFAAARRYVDAEKVPAMKLAALCIVFEDGKYQLAEDKPLMATVSTDSSCWVITRITAPGQGEQTEFGLEMEKAADMWRVSGLNLSKLLSDNAKASDVAGVPYTPLVKNPKGGESVALFFEYDQAALHPRAQKQLDVIIGLLRASPQKRLRISGFTDALGSDAYNLNLSRGRAEAVKQYILSKGVPLAQVETTGFGKALPLSPNVKPDGSDNPEGRSRNRRAEILLDF